MSVEIAAIRKRFGDIVALRGVDLEIRSGELVALLGPSGSGKTTLLRIIAGLEWADEGSIRFDGEDATSRSARERRVGFVFQHYALFRHMTVFDNVAFGLRVRPRAERPSSGEIAERVRRLLDLVRIGQLSSRYSSELSGGQRQRVALARALAIEPRVLLLDEPFGALDAKVRRELRRWLRQLHESMGMTTVFVTHDQEEALELADRVVVMGDGRIEQVGTPAEIYDQPVNPFVYRFLGSVNVLPCTLINGTVRVPGVEVVQVDQPTIGRGPASVFVRPHDIAVEPDRVGNFRVVFAAVSGPIVRIEVERHDGGDRIEIELPRHVSDEIGLALGQSVNLRILSAHVFATPAAPTGKQPPQSSRSCRWKPDGPPGLSGGVPARQVWARCGDQTWSHARRRTFG
jgi:sulfate/thiosulfate transport system ATP-binding protein